VQSWRWDWNAQNLPWSLAIVRARPESESGEI